ncbi:MAG: IS21 family transposase, partial [Deltaproteobacteria bacterium]
MKQIQQELGHSYWTVRKALDVPEPQPYQRTQPTPAPVLGPYKERIQELLAENEHLPRKQHYTSRRIYQIIRGEGYQGAESTLRRYVSQCRKENRRPQVFLPLGFPPGQAGQVDWGEGQVVMANQPRAVQLFIMRLCYSRRTFVMAFPTQRQEAFFLGHAQAFPFFQGVPRTLIYDNLKTAVYKILSGRNRMEQAHFTRLRSHYLFEARYCTPGAGHEKGGVESAVGYVRRNFLTPPPQVADFSELNQLLLAACLEEDQRILARMDRSIGERWQEERPHLQPLP